MANERNTMNQVKCNNCGWTGDEDDLVIFEEDGKYGDGYGGKGCPNCKTDAYLADVEPAPAKLGGITAEQAKACESASIWNKTPTMGEDIMVGHTPAKHTLRFELGELSDGGHELYLDYEPLGNLCGGFLEHPAEVIQGIVTRHNAYYDLLEALKEVLSEIQAIVDDGTLRECDVNNHLSIIKARAAITKATHG
jgi:hypothetical protein